MESTRPHGQVCRGSHSGQMDAPVMLTARPGGLHPQRSSCEVTRPYGSPWQCQSLAIEPSGVQALQPLPPRAHHGSHAPLVFGWSLKVPAGWAERPRCSDALCNI